MKQRSVRLLLLAALAGLSRLAYAQDVAHPDTASKLRAAVDLYYQSKPATVRPTRAELAFGPQPTCQKPRYPRATTLYELEGTAILSFQVDAQGRPRNANIDRSSGWAILDEAAVEALAQCRYEPGDGEAWQKLSFKFSLP